MKLKNFKLFTESLGQPIVLTVEGNYTGDLLSLDTYGDDAILAPDNVYDGYDDDDYDDENEDNEDGGFGDADEGEIDEAIYYAKLLEWTNDFIKNQEMQETFSSLNLGISSIRAVEHLPYDGRMYPSLNFEFTMESDWEEQFEEVLESINPKRLKFFLEDIFTQYNNKEDLEYAYQDPRTRGNAVGTVAAFLIGKAQYDQWKTEVNDTLIEILHSNYSKDHFVRR